MSNLKRLCSYGFGKRGRKEFLLLVATTFSSLSEVNYNVFYCFVGPVLQAKAK